MKARSVWMPLYVREYLTDTGHLSLEQSGAYLHLLMHSWAIGPLPDDDAKLARMCRVSEGKWLRSIKADVLAFFVLGDGGWTQKRLENERRRAVENSATASKNASAKWRKNKETTEADVDALNLKRKEKEEVRKEEPPISPVPKPAAKAAQATLALDLPSWLPKQAWIDFVDSRRKMRHPMTDRAQALLLSKLDGFRRRGVNVEAALNQAVLRGWRDVFEPKPDHQNASVVPFRRSATEARTDAVMWAAGLAESPDDGVTIDHEIPQEAWR